MRKTLLLLLWVAGAGGAHALSVPPPPPISQIAPEVFRSISNHHNKPCSNVSYSCLAHHLMYLQCGAILLEKMALGEEESPRWYAYSMHSGPSVPFIVAGYEILKSFDSSLPAMWYTGQEFDPRAKIRGDYESANLVWPDDRVLSNWHLMDFVLRTLDWLNSQKLTITDACHLQDFWRELRENSFALPQEFTTRKD